MEQAKERNTHKHDESKMGYNIGLKTTGFLLVPRRNDRVRDSDVLLFFDNRHLERSERSCYRLVHYLFILH